MRTHLVARAIGVSQTACTDEFRGNLRSHSWTEFEFYIIFTGAYIVTITFFFQFNSCEVLPPATSADN